MAGAGNGKGMADMLGDAMGAGGQAFADQLGKGVAAFNTSGDIKELVGVIQKLKEAAAERKAAAAADAAAGPGKKGGTDPATDLVQAMKPQISAMQRVAGGSLSRGMMNMDIQKVRHLKSIDNKLTGIGTARYA